MFSLWIIINSQNWKKIFLRLPFLSYFSVSVCYYFRGKKCTAFDISRCHYVMMANRSSSAWKKKKIQTFVLCPELYWETNPACPHWNQWDVWIWQLPVWSLVKANYTSALGPKQKNVSQKITYWKHTQHHYTLSFKTLSQIKAFSVPDSFIRPKKRGNYSK